MVPRQPEWTINLTLVAYARCVSIACNLLPLGCARKPASPPRRSKIPETRFLRKSIVFYQNFVFVEMKQTMDCFATVRPNSKFLARLASAPPGVFLKIYLTHNLDLFHGRWDVFFSRWWPCSW